MHEWALAEAVLNTAIKVSKEEKLKEIKKLKIKLGELQQIDINIFKFALQEILKPQSFMFKHTQFEFEEEEALLKCRICKNEWKFSDALKGLSEDESETIHFIPEMAHVYLKCSKCGSPDFEVIKGRGVWIASIEGVEG